MSFFESLSNLFRPQQLPRKQYARDLLKCNLLTEDILAFPNKKFKDTRRIFLHKGSFHKFRGYAYAQLKKITDHNFKGLKEVQEFEDEFSLKKSLGISEIQDILSRMQECGDMYVRGLREDPSLELSQQDLTKYLGLKQAASVRVTDVQNYGFSLKEAYHVVRLCLECEQILVTGDLVVDRDRELYKALRRGEWSLEKINDFFEEKEKVLEKLYHESTKIPYSPDESGIHNLLCECLEMHYKDLCIRVPDVQEFQKALDSLEDVKKVISRHLFSKT